MRIALWSAILLISLIASASAQTRVSGYMRQNGTYVAPYYRTNSDWTPMNNWSYYGNTNPYTGSIGTHRTIPAPSFPRGYTPESPLSPSRFYAPRQYSPYSYPGW